MNAINYLNRGISSVIRRIDENRSNGVLAIVGLAAHAFAPQYVIFGSLVWLGSEAVIKWIETPDPEFRRIARLDEIVGENRAEPVPPQIQVNQGPFVIAVRSQENSEPSIN